jgi:hypothetical protein
VTVPRFQIGNHIFDRDSALAAFNVTQGCTYSQSIVVTCLDFSMLAFPFIPFVGQFVPVRPGASQSGVCAICVLLARLSSIFGIFQSPHFPVNSCEK